MDTLVSRTRALVAVGTYLLGFGAFVVVVVAAVFDGGCDTFNDAEVGVERVVDGVVDRVVDMDVEGVVDEVIADGLPLLFHLILGT